MYCTKCSSEIPVGEPRCQTCGALPQTRTHPITAGAPRYQSRHVLFAGILGGLAGALLLSATIRFSPSLAGLAGLGSEDTVDVVVAKRFILLSEKNQPLAVLGTDSVGVPGLAFLDSELAARLGENSSTKLNFVHDFGSTFRPSGGESLPTFGTQRAYFGPGFLALSSASQDEPPSAFHAVNTRGLGPMLVMSHGEGAGAAQFEVYVHGTPEFGIASAQLLLATNRSRSTLLSAVSSLSSPKGTAWLQLQSTESLREPGFVGEGALPRARALIGLENGAANLQLFDASGRARKVP